MADATTRKEMARRAILSAPIVPALLRLALPTIAVLFTQALVGIAETYYVGHLGTDALVGVALVFPIWMLMTTLSSGGIGSGVAASVARAVGAGRQQHADALVLHAVSLAVILGLLTTIGLRLLGRPLYYALGGRGGALEAALDYSNYVFLGAVPIWIVNLLCCALRGAGEVKVPAMVTLAGALILIPVSPLLIFGFGPIPSFGIAGAGLAVTLYYSAAAIALLRYMASGRSGLTLAPARLDWTHYRDILGVGIVSAIGSIQLNLTVMLVTGAVGGFGREALAGYGTAARLDYMMMPLLFGLASATLTMVGICVGAGDIRRAIRITWIGCGISAAVAEVIGITVAVFPALWLRLFTVDPAVLAAGSGYLRIVGPTYFAMTAVFILGFAAQGGGRPLWPVLGGTLRLLVAAGLGWIVVTQFSLGLTALFIVVAAGSLCAGAVSAAATYLGLTLRIHQTGSSQVEQKGMAGEGRSRSRVMII